MRNYQKLYYQHYYIMLSNGAETEVTRRECFAPAKEPTEVNPYKQRWFYDPEASYAIRLPRNQKGENLGKRNAADLKKEERVQSGKAEHCGFELDKPIGYGDDGTEAYTEIEDVTSDVEAIFQDQAELEALISVLDRLAPDDRELWKLMKAQTKKQDIADRFGITLDGVYYREKRLKFILRSDRTLKSFYTGE